MLKRLSGTFTGGSSSDPALLLPPRSPGVLTKASSPRTSPSLLPISLPPLAPRSPGQYQYQQQQQAGYPFPQQQQQAGGIERATLHKSLAALSALLVALDELRDAKLVHAKAEKRVAKALKELAAGFTDKGAGGAGGGSEVVVEALGAASSMLEVLGETETKHAKGVQKEYEALNDSVSKFFKRTAKEEKAYEDTIATLDNKVAKATSSYQSAAASSSSRNMHAHLDSLTSQHSSYMSALSTLSAQITTTKAQYAAAIAGRRELVAREVGRVACGIAEREWHSRVEGVKRGGGATLGRVVSAGAWCETGMEGAASLFEPATESHGARAPTPSGPLRPATTSTDVSPPLTGGRSGERTRSNTLHGPRAPSTSTTQTATTTTSTSTHSSHPSASSAPSYASRRSSGGGPGPGVSFAAASTPASSALRETTPRPSSAQYPPPSSPRGSYDGRETLRSDTFRDVAGAPQAADMARDEAAAGVLRRPTPRYGSAPPLAATSFGHGEEADEFGRRRERERDEGGARAGTVPQRQDSFVARMSAKYASEASEAQQRERQHAPLPAPPPPTRPTHARSSSRVSLLAKQYSSPPDGATGPAAGTATSSRPAPPQRGWTDAPRASAPYPSASPSPPPPPAPPARRRAYESAQPLPPVAAAAPRGPERVSVEEVEERWRAGTWTGREWHEASGGVGGVEGR